MKFNFTLLSNLLSATKKRSSLCSRQPKEVISDASIATAASISSTSIRTAVEPNINEWCSNCIEIFPLPLIIDKTLSGTMYIQNTRSCYWMAVRVIVYSVCMKVFPQKFLVPPARKAAMDISIVWIPTCPRQYNLIVQWFPVGSDCPPCNSELIWKKPYRKISKKRWSQRIVCVYFEPDYLPSKKG
uniref:Secreted protein n=1 Tax=Parascaris univalens TaxID=6257 RepID=A0A914ZJ57_PARUN